jgi:hypothetical protein
VGDVECDSEEAARSKYEDTFVVDDDVVDVITECEDEDVDRVRSSVVVDGVRQGVAEEFELATLGLRITRLWERRRVLDCCEDVEGDIRS